MLHQETRQRGRICRAIFAEQLGLETKRQKRTVREREREMCSSDKGTGVVGFGDGMAGGGLVRFSVLRSSQLLISCLRDLRLQSSFLEGKMPAWGVPGAYSEAAALKAYSQCENAVKLWLADKTVLPIENSLGGSIHRNYDLLLWHKLHIVGEVQLAVNLCLLALPGVRTEHLKRVLSHPQTCHSDVCNCSSIWGFKICPSLEEQMLEVISIIFQLRYDYKVTRKQLLQLGATREKVNDTARKLPVLIVLTLGQLVASNELRDAGAVASARAAEIYGLDILAERIQCGRYSCSKKYHFSPSHTGMLATGSYGQTTAIYREDNMELLYILHGQQGGVRDMCNSQKMVTIYIQGGNSGDGRSFGLMLTLGLYRSSENTNQRILFDIDPFGQHLGTGSEDGLVQIYNLQMGQWVSSFQAALALHQGRFVSFDDSLEDFSLSGDENCASIWSFAYASMADNATCMDSGDSNLCQDPCIVCKLQKRLRPPFGSHPHDPLCLSLVEIFFLFFLFFFIF
ncbi:unnamed protein product [Camellia sinensis]